MGWRSRARELGVQRGTTELILKRPLIECFGQTKKIGTPALRWTFYPKSQSDCPVNIKTWSLSLVSLPFQLYLHYFFCFSTINLHQCLLLAGMEMIGIFSLFLMGDVILSIHGHSFKFSLSFSFLFLFLILSHFHLLFSFFAIDIHQCLLLAGVKTIGMFSLFLTGGIPFTIHSICNSIYIFLILFYGLLA